MTTEADRPARYASFPVRDLAAVSREISLLGERVRVVEAGKATGIPVLLLHGWGGSAYSFRQVLPLLAKEGLRAIAPDLRGHGWSARPVTPGSCTSEAFVSWVRSLMDHLAIERCVLAGQSIGGAIALDCALAMPGRVPAAVLIAPIGFTPIRRVTVARVLRLSRWKTGTTPRWVVKLILRRIYGTRREWTEEDVDEYWAPLREHGSVSSLMQVVHEFDFSPRRFGVPLRLVVRFGELDRLIPWEQAVSHARLSPGADVAVIRGAGHVPAEEAPGEVAAAIAGATRHHR